jgi:hypothetical protein
MTMGKIEDIDTSDVRRLVFDYTNPEGDRDIAAINELDSGISVHRVRQADGTFRASVNVSFYGRGSVGGEGHGETWEDALTQAEANLGDLSKPAHLHYMRHVFVGVTATEAA